MTSTVNVLCPNGRRENVKVNANTRILQVIETVCAKQGFDPAEHNLKHYRSIVDAQLPICYANLPNNAKLELVKSDIVRKESPTQLALQLQSGERVQHSFASSTSLWNVLEHWENQPESAHKGQLMSAKQGENDQLLHPVCIYMRQEIIGQAALQSTTLRTLGLVGGKALIRLIHRAADLPPIETLTPTQKPATKTVPTSASKVESTGASSSHSNVDNTTDNKGGNMVSQQGQETQMEVDSSSSKSSQATPMDVDVSSSSEGVATSGGRAKETGARPKETETPITLTREQEKLANDMGAALAQAIMQQRGGEGGAGPSTSTSSSTFVPQPSPFANFKFPEPSVPPSGSSGSTQQQKTVKPCDRLPIVYNNEILPGEAQMGDVPEEFFNVTISDVQRMYQDLRTQSSRHGEQNLETKAMREARELREMQRYPKVVVRIHFPDKFILQGFFRPQETVEAVSEFVKSHLGDTADKFYLYTTPPKTVLKDQKQTLFAAKLCPATVVHFGSSSEKDHYLSEITLSQVETLMKADELVGTHMQQHHASSSSPSTVSSSDIAGPSSASGSGGSASGGLQAPASSYADNRRQQGAAASSAGTSGKVPKWFKVGKFRVTGSGVWMGRPKRSKRGAGRKEMKK